MSNIITLRTSKAGPKPENFFNIFNYNHMMHDAIDGGLVYECIDITRDLCTASGLKLWKGDSYEACWFLFKKGGVFQFIDWVSSDPNIPDHYNRIPDPKTFIEISQAEMAPFIHWNESP